MAKRLWKVLGNALVACLVCAASVSPAAERPAGPPVHLQPSDVKLPVDAAALERQYQALSAMPAAKVTYSELGLVRLIEGETGVVLSSGARALREGDSAAEVLDRFRDVLLASGDETLKVRLNIEGVARTRVMRLDQYIRGIPVLNGGVSLDVEQATGIVRIMGAYFLPDRELPREAKLTVSEATALTVQMLEAREVAKLGTVKVSSLPTLAYHGISPDSTRGRLVWAVIASYASASSGDRSNGIYWIDAIDGEYVGEGTLTVAALNRTVYTANNGAPDPDTFPTGLTVLFSEGGSSSDQLAMNVYTNAGKANTAYASLFSWNADPLALIVHYNTGPPNAGTTRVSGVDYLHFSDGNAERYPYGDVLDVVGHEFGHTITRKVAGIVPGPDPLSDPQSAALEEAFSDVSAINVDAYHRPGIADATWVIGEVFRNDATKGIRSAANPKSMSTSAQDWFPARVLGPHPVSRYPNTTIMTHAYKLLVTGGFHVRAGQPIGGTFTGNIPLLHVSAVGQDLASGQDKASRIFHRALENPTMATWPDFVKLKAAAELAATQLYGEFERDAVDRALRAVGVGVGCTAPPAAPVLVAEDYCPLWRLIWAPAPGATSYQAQRKPAAWSWTQSTTIVDGNFGHCMQQVASFTAARLRACNGCGCSGWSNTVEMFKWAQCP